MAIFHPHPTIHEADPTKVCIVVEHKPIHILEVSEKGYDVFLAGHTHAGQFWVNRVVTKKMFLVDYGMKMFNQLHAITSSGYGSWGALFRLGVKPEIVVLHIKGKA